MLLDLRSALRQLTKSPGFTAVAVLTLALSIGACTAIFSVVNGVLLRPLDYPSPDRIMVVKEMQPGDRSDFSVSPPNFVDWQRQAKSFACMAAVGGATLNLTGAGEPQRLVGAKATARYFDVYGFAPALGRFPRPEEDTPGKNHVVVLSHAFWQRFFGGANDVLTRTLQLNGEPYTIIGVAPAGFGAQWKLDAWVPMAFSPAETANGNRGAHYVNVVGRLRSDATVQQANAEIEVIAAQLAQQYPDSNKGWSAYVQPLLESNVRDVRGVLYTLLAAVGCVLLIACANLASLLLARTSSRQREISVRAALGAGNGRIIRQLLTESVVLAILGGLGGVLLASWGLSTLLALAPANLPRASSVGLDGRVLGFALALSIVTGLVFGLAPAWFATRVPVNESLKQGARGTTEGGTRGRLRSLLVALEVAVCVVLLSGAGLLVRSFEKLVAVNPGFVAQNATAMRLALPARKYDSAPKQAAFADALLERLHSLRGVNAAAVANTLPIVGDWVLSFEIDGRPVAPSDQPSSNYYAVSAEYFRAMGIRTLRGRTFTEHDDARSAPVAIVNETFARSFFPGENPLGKRINITNGPTIWREIVGVVADVTQYSPDRPTTAQMYEPFAQRPSETVSVVIRTDPGAEAVANQLRPTVYAVDSDQPVGSIQPLEEILSGSIARQRFTMLLLTVFSIAALLIAAIGIYGVMAYNVTQRTAEIGVRMALGATARDVLRLVLGQGARVVGAGLLVGLAATIASSQAINALLFQTTAFDPVTLATVLVLLVGAAAIACLVPARRATQVDPMVALRGD